MTVQILTASDKERVFDMHLAGYTNVAIARDFGVSEKTIRRILKEVEAEHLARIKQNLSHYEEAYDPVFDEDEDEYMEDIEEGDVTESLLTTELPKYMYVATNTVIVITRLSDGERVVIREDHPRFLEAMDYIEDLSPEDTHYNNFLLEEAFLLGSVKAQLSLYEKDGIILDREEGVLKYRDEAGTETKFHGRLVEKILKALEDKGDLSKKFTSLVSFAKRLSKNPSHRAVNELFDFLDAADIKILPDGKVRCFKKVRSTFKDIHSNSMDNSVGKVVSVPRNQVDEDSDVTCSYGLHVCSKSYLPHFSSNGDDVILEVHVDPADFVAIPRDYNNAKARVSSYYVAGVVDYNDI